MNLKCAPQNLHYYYSTKRGRLYMPEGECCDMNACIAMFKNIDGDVQRIETYSGDKPDTIYTKGADGAWSAATP